MKDQQRWGAWGPSQKSGRIRYPWNSLVISFPSQQLRWWWEPNDQTFSFFFLPLARVPRQPTADSRRWRTSWPTWCFLRRSARESMRRIPWLLKMILVHRRYHSHSLLGTATMKNLQNGWRFAITIYFPGQGKPFFGARFSEKSRKAHQIFPAAGFRLESWSIPHFWKDRYFKTQPQNINISWDQLALRTGFGSCGSWFLRRIRWTSSWTWHLLGPQWINLVMTNSWKSWRVYMY